MTAIRVMVVDDHPLITQGLASALKPFGIDEVEALADGTQAVARYEAVQPDVLVLDLRIGQVRGLDVARNILAKDPSGRIVFYSQFDQDHIVQEAYRIGGKAFVTKNADMAVLAKAITVASEGQTYFVPEIAERLAFLSVRGDESPQAKLNERELLVFKRMAQGLTHAEIAEELKLSSKTIGLITQSIKEALGVSRPADITRLAIKHQLIDE